MRSLPLLVVVAGLALAGGSTAADASLLPHNAERAIARSLPRAFIYVPVRAPLGWRYHSWDAGRETPDLFPRGRGLNIWFSTPYPNQFCARCSSRMPYGAGFHVYADSRCSVHGAGAMATFHIGKITVAWSATSEDALAWRCVRARHPVVMISVSFAGIGVGGPPARSERVAVRHAAAVARMLASSRLVPAG